MNILSQLYFILPIVIPLSLLHITLIGIILANIILLSLLHFDMGLIINPIAPGLIKYHTNPLFFFRITANLDKECALTKLLFVNFFIFRAC